MNLVSNGPSYHYTLSLINHSNLLSRNDLSLFSHSHNPITSSHKHFPPGFHNNAFSVTNNHHFLIIMLLSLQRNVGLMWVRVIFPIHLCLNAKCVSWKVSLGRPSFSLADIRLWMLHANATASFDMSNSALLQ